MEKFHVSLVKLIREGYSDFYQKLKYLAAEGLIPAETAESAIQEGRTIRKEAIQEYKNAQNAKSDPNLDVNLDAIKRAIELNVNKDDLIDKILKGKEKKRPIRVKEGWNDQLLLEAKAEEVEAAFYHIVIGDSIRESMRVLMRAVRGGYIDMKQIREDIDKEKRMIKEAKGSLSAMMNHDGIDVNWKAVRYCLRKQYMVKTSGNCYMFAFSDK